MKSTQRVARDLKPMLVARFRWTNCERTCVVQSENGSPQSSLPSRELKPNMPTRAVRITPERIEILLAKRLQGEITEPQMVDWRQRRRGLLVAVEAVSQGSRFVSAGLAGHILAELANRQVF